MLLKFEAAMFTPVEKLAIATHNVLSVNYYYFLMLAINLFLQSQGHVEQETASASVAAFFFLLILFHVRKCDKSSASF